MPPLLFLNYAFYQPTFDNYTWLIWVLIITQMPLKLTPKTFPISKIPQEIYKTNQNFQNLEN